jgi:putative transposase
MWITITNVRLQSAIGYVIPKDMLAGRQAEIRTERDRKLEAARQQRQSRRQQAVLRPKWLAGRDVG